MRVPLSQIYDVETFYAFYSTKKRGKVLIQLCKSAPCHVKGALEVLEAFERDLGIKAGETTADGEFTLETCECIGACAVSPAALVDDTVHGNLSPESVHEFISLLRKGA
jgi:NADH-quinone oxidoreductase subunit E